MSHTVYFCNAEPIDLNAISLMGVSVKTRDNPVGFFGTGLKYSIATLLRTGHQIDLIRAGHRIPFTVRSESIRGEEFDRVMMGEEPLGFTTKLGRSWEPWQAYRELYCNCTDEGGVISDERPAGDFGTVFVVTGEGIARCHRERDEIILSSKPIAQTSDAAIHRGGSPHAFYRGVRAHQHNTIALFTYNIKARMELTEDRTVKHSYYVAYHVANLVPQIDDEDVIEKILLAPPASFEKSLNYELADKPCDAFMRTVRRLRHNAHLNLSALKLWEKYADIKYSVTEAALDQFEELLLEKAFLLLRRLGCQIERHDFVVVDGLGESIFGTVRRNHILISRRVFDYGETFVASTIYEEWLHRDKQMADESRDLQNFLFEKLLSMTARLCAMEAAA